MTKYCLDKSQISTVFTIRESQCLTYLINDQTIEQTADALNVSPKTVEFYLKNMKEKLGCVDEKELIEKLKITNLIELFKESPL